MDDIDLATSAIGRRSAVFTQMSTRLDQTAPKTPATNVEPLADPTGVAPAVPSPPRNPRKHW